MIPRGREIGRRHDFNQLVDADRGIREHSEARVDDFGEIVRRDVGRHADRDARRSINQQIRQARRQDRWFLLFAVVIRDEIDRFLVDIGGELVGDPLQPALGVAHRRRVVAIDRAEVALAVDQRVAERKVLRHPNQRVVDRHVAVRMVFTHHLADDPGTLHIRPVPDGVGFVHCIEDAPVHGLEAIAHVGQRPADDHAHRIIEV
jgi:hypothetical protein